MKEKKKPRMNDDGIPVWWNKTSMKTGISSYSPNQVNFSINEGQTIVTINRMSGLPGTVYFDLIWVKKSNLKDYETKGKIFLTELEFKGAFNLLPSSCDYKDDKESKWLISKHGADAVCQGKFIRYKDFLNIPGPGYGFDEDPNASIYLWGNDIKIRMEAMLNY